MQRGKHKLTLLHFLVMGLPQNQGCSHKFHNPLTSPPASQGITEVHNDITSIHFLRKPYLIKGLEQGVQQRSTTNSFSPFLHRQVNQNLS